MDLTADLPVTLVVKAANQRVADQTVECVLGWTIRKLKQHLESVYPSKPKHHQQKLIYSGQLLADHLTLKEVLRQIDQNSQHTVHLVCSPSVDSMSQPGPSQSQSSTEKKSEPQANTSQSSLSSANESDGLRHRGGQLSGASSSHSEATNPGGNQATAPAGAGLSLPAGMGAMGGMGGVPVMGAGGPMMAMPGYGYTPEQIAWMQQMYSQYMNQYMQYYGYQAPAVAQPAHPVQAPATQPAANPGPVNNPPPNQNLRMNAQGGLEEDDEEEQRDWLDYIYVCFRFLVLASILYFYSSASRFFAVAAGCFILYMIRNGWGMWNRRQEQQQDVQQPPVQQQQQQQPPPPPQQQQQQQQQQPAQNQAEGNEAERQRDSHAEEARDQEGEAAAPVDDNQPAANPEQDSPPTSMVLLRMLLSFFTSLVPERPPAVNGN